MGKRKMRRLFSFGMLIVLFCSGIAFRAYSETLSDLEDESETNQAAIEDAIEQYEAIGDEIAQKQAEVLQLELQQADLTDAINELDDQIDAKQTDIEATQEELDETQDELDTYYDQTKKRIKVMYEHGSSDYVEVLLESENAVDFFNRLEYLNKIVEYDDNMLDEIESIKEEIQEQEDTLKSEKQDLENTQDEQNQKLNEVETLRTQKAAKIKELQSSQEFIERQKESLEAEQDEIDAKIEAAKALAAQMQYDGSTLSWPLPGWTTITSPFGYRIHPIYGYYSLHAGIDIAASYGTGIQAAASGTVIFAGWGTAYGNYILLDHGVDDDGNHIVTQYAHCSELLVSEGDTVTRGEIIAKVGSTGWSTGNHLHFGVKVGDEWQDPTTWVTPY